MEQNAMSVIYDKNGMTEQNIMGADKNGLTTGCVIFAENLA